MRSLLAFLVGFSALFVYSTTAGAQGKDVSEYARSGFYVGANVQGAGYAKITDDLENDQGRKLAEMDLAVGFSIYGGYRAHPNVALEAEFEMMPSTDLKLRSLDTTIAEVETWAFTGNAKFLALSGPVQPFLLVGLGVLHGEARETSGLGLEDSAAVFAARLGGGVEAYFTESIVMSLRATYVLPTSDLELFGAGRLELDYVSFGGGLQYRF